MVSAEVLARMFEEKKFEAAIDPAELVTYAMKREIRQYNYGGSNELVVAERQRRYPDVAALGRVINSDTRLVVVDPSLRGRIVAREKLSTRDLISGSVQIWANKIDSFALEPIRGREEIYWWPYDYDSKFIGYMAGAFSLRGISEGEAFIL
jgi:CRISPR-associated endonuclease/helicase Cas3